MDTTNDNEQEAPSGSSQSGIPNNQENQYWSRITPGQLQESTQAEKPSTSKKVSKQPNVPPLDDSTVPCSICLSDMREEDQENDDVVVQLTMCTHMFHEGCIRVRFFYLKKCKSQLLVGIQSEEAVPAVHVLVWQSNWLPTA